MASDHDIDGWLTGAGLDLPETRARMRELLEAEGLTRSGKKRISDEKIPRVKALLAGRFFLHCGSPECLRVARESNREPLLAARQACERCGGSVNHGAGMALIEAFRRKGFRKLCVVGGSPSVRQELETELASSIDLRMVDGTERRTGDRARGDLEWADLVLVWGASELHHKVSMLYTQGPAALRHKVLTVPKRGVAALLTAAVEHLQKV